MSKPDPTDPAPTFDEVLELAEGRNRAEAAPKSVTVALAQLLARAHRGDGWGKQPILVQLPPKRSQ